MKALLHSFLTLALDGGEWLTKSSGRFTPGREPRNSLNGRLGGIQSQSLRFWRRETLLRMPGFEPRTMQPIASRSIQLCYVFIIKQALF